MRIELAREPAFSLGRIEVRPSTRELIAPNGRQVLEPRVMQVLVALAKAQGATVTRDELVEACWDGRAVSEDAVNRVVSALRRLSEGGAGGSFAIETVTKVGYRLTREIGEHGDPPCLAIAPFTTRSGFAEDEALAFGMVEDIASAVAQPCTFLRVLAPSTTRAWANSAQDLSATAREFGATYLLEGNVRRAGVDLRVAVKLIDTQSGIIAWSAQFERPLAELAALQESLVTEMAGRLGVELHEIEMARALKKPGDITAYEALQRALAHWWNLSAANFPLLVAEARRAVAIVPEYGYAHGVLAYALALQFVWSDANGAAGKQEALDHARHAISIDPNDAMALTFAAGAFICLDLLDEALRCAQRALELKPGFVTAQQQFGLVGLRLGRNDEAVRSFDDVERASPGHPSLHLTYLRRSHAHVQAGRLEDAIADMERAFRFNANYCPTLVLRAGLCTLIGRDDDATEAVQRLRALEPAMSVDAQAARALTWLHREQSAELMVAFRKAWEQALAAPGD